MAEHYFKQTNLGDNWVEITLRIQSPVPLEDIEQHGEESNMTALKFIFAFAIGVCRRHNPMLAATLQTYFAKLQDSWRAVGQQGN